MSERLWSLLSGKLDEIAAFYKVRPRITLIVRMPGKPNECAFLSDDNWTDAVATVKCLSGDGGTFAAGPPEPPPESTAPAPSPARDEVREAAEAFRVAAEAWGNCTCNAPDECDHLLRKRETAADLAYLTVAWLDAALSRPAPAPSPLPPAVREAYRGVLLYPYGSPLHKAEWRKLCAALDGKPEGGE